MQLVTTTFEAILSLCCVDIDKAIDYGVQRKFAQNQSKLAALKAEVEEPKNELVEEKSRKSSYLEEMEELRLTTKLQDDRRHRAEEKQLKVKKERKEMATHLAKAIEDRTVT